MPRGRRVIHCTVGGPVDAESLCHGDIACSLWHGNVAGLSPTFGRIDGFVVDTVLYSYCPITGIVIALTDKCIDIGGGPVSRACVQGLRAWMCVGICGWVFAATRSSRVSRVKR